MCSVATKLQHFNSLTNIRMLAAPVEISSTYLDTALSFRSMYVRVHVSDLVPLFFCIRVALSFEHIPWIICILCLFN